MKRRRRELGGDEVLEVATSLAREAGLTFSMRELADRLNTWPNALYKFFPTKQALQSAVIDRVANELLTEEAMEHLADTAIPWQDRMRAISLVMFEAGAQVPGMGRLMTHESMFESPALIRLVFSIVDQLNRVGLSRHRAGELVQIVAFYLLNMAELEAAQRQGTTTVGQFKEGTDVEETVLRDVAIDALLAYEKKDRFITGLNLMIRAVEQELLDLQRR